MKHVSDIENSENFRILITQDLKEYGIKLPKTRKNKSKRDKSSQRQICESSQQTGIFGEELCHVPLTELNNYGSVPKFLVEAVHVLDKHLTVEGIFRKAGSVARQKELKIHIEDGGGLEDANPLDLACLVKQFFRELPEPLLTIFLHDAFLQCNTLSEEDLECGTPDIRSASILQLCLLLPPLHVSTLRYITSFLQRVAKHAEVNKMGTDNLAMCLAPNFLHSCMSDKQQVSPNVLQAQAKVVAVLIIHAEDIGRIPDALWERAELLAACYPSDDEQEGGNGQNDSKTKKKKRRSGSLQGMISNLSNSFTKWRGKDGKGHNSSNISDRSTFSTMSYVSFTSTEEEGVDDNATLDADTLDMASTLPKHMLDPDNEATPKMMRKRKAEEEAVPFSATKRKAILQSMPQMSALGGTPFTPQTRRQDRVQTDFQNTPSIKFSSSGVIFSATPSIRSSQRKNNSPTKAKRNASVKSGCFSSDTSKNGVRKSVRSFIRRLSGNREQTNADSANTAEGALMQESCDSDNLSHSTQKKKGLFRRHKRAPSPQGRLITSLNIEHQSLNSREAASHSSMINDENLEISYAHSNLSVQSEIVRGASRRHRRSITADSSLNSSSLRRGRPNTLTTGLPSPVKRRSIDTSSLKQGHSPFVSPEKSDNPSALDTSPILGVGSLDVVGHISDHEDDDMFQRSPLMRQSSKTSLSSEMACHTPGDSDHDQAFIHESMLIADDAANPGEDGNAKNGQPDNMETPPEHCSSEGSRSSQYVSVSRLKSQKSIESLDSGIDVTTFNKTESLHSIASGDSGVDGQCIEPVSNTDLPSPHMSHTVQSEALQTTRDKPRALKVNHLVAMDCVDPISLTEDAKEIAARKASPLRFANSTSRRRMSPVRIPTIFAKADAEAQKYRDSINKKPSEHLVTLSASKRAVHLPISTSLVRSVKLDPVRTKLALDENNEEDVKTPESHRAPAQDTAGHTPHCSRITNSLQAIEIDNISEANKEPLHHSNRVNITSKPPPAATTTSTATPVIKPVLGASASLASRRFKSSKATTRTHCSPVKPVKRLQVSSPHSPLKTSDQSGSSLILRKKQTVV